MNRLQNSGWQGAAHVAQARLQTIDQALAKLEAILPNVEDPPSTKNHPQDDDPNPKDHPVKPSNHKKNPIPLKQNGPKPLPPLSLRALEAFLTEPAYHLRYAPKAA